MYRNYFYSSLYVNVKNRPKKKRKKTIMIKKFCLYELLFKNKFKQACDVKTL